MDNKCFYCEHEFKDFEDIIVVGSARMYKEYETIALKTHQEGAVVSFHYECFGHMTNGSELYRELTGTKIFAERDDTHMLENEAKNVEVQSNR